MIICLYHARCMVTDILMYKDQKGNVQITDAHIIMIHYIAIDCSLNWTEFGYRVILNYIVQT